MEGWLVESVEVDDKCAGRYVCMLRLRRNCSLLVGVEYTCEYLIRSLSGISRCCMYRLVSCRAW
jgi:hypothetical protein